MAIVMEGINRSLSYEIFLEKMLSNFSDYISDDNKIELKANNIKPAEYFKGGSAEICVCPEPINFYSEITKFEKSSEKVQKFHELKEGFTRFRAVKPEKNYWPNKTWDGINIRLGNVDGDRGDQSPAVLGDDCVHGVIVGRTGAGKSVLINNIILNLIAEYSPWELDLFLVDMKKVELSRYMKTLRDGNGNDRYITPQVSACAATSEVRYVVSMIEYLSNCMKARQTLFAALGVQKLSDFREKFNVTLPRILLLVDEFQQLFLEASGKERRILDECITSITKLGRATGFHLLFASQEMSGALGAKELANFKLRIALPCDESISSQILGNSQASEITEKGITLVNKKGGSGREDNIKYRTPFVNDKSDDDGESEFERVLTKVFQLTTAPGYQFSKNQKFYQEDVQDRIEAVGRLKNNPRVADQISSARLANASILDAFILGSGVLYTNKSNDYESVFLEKGKRRNIGILCVKDEDIVNVMQTLSENFSFSSLKCNHYVDYESELLRSGYSELIDALGKGRNTAQEIDFEGIKEEVDRIKSSAMRNNAKYKITADEIEHSRWEAAVKKIKNRIIDLSRSREIFEDMIYSANEMVKQHGGREFRAKKDPIAECFGLYNSKIIDEFEKICSNGSRCGSNDYGEINNSLRDLVQSAVDSAEKEYENDTKSFDLCLRFYILQRLVNVVPNDNKPPKANANDNNSELNVFWVLGMDNLDAEMDKFLDSSLDTCTLNNMLFILAGNSLESDRRVNPFKYCNYIFLSSPNESLYNKFRMSFTKHSDDSKAVDFKIINFNDERAFKLFRTDSKSISAPKLNFDGLE